MSKETDLVQQAVGGNMQPLLEALSREQPEFYPEAPGIGDFDTADDPLVDAVMVAWMKGRLSAEQYQQCLAAASGS